MGRARERRTYVVLVWDRREEVAIALRIEAYTAAEARADARRAGWHDGILSTWRETEPPVDILRAKA